MEPSHLSFLPPSLSCLSFKFPAQIQLEGLGSFQSFATRSGQSPTDRRSVVHAELKITLPLIALLQFSDDGVCTVTHIGRATYTSIVIPRKEVGLRYGLEPATEVRVWHIPSYFQVSALVISDVVLGPWLSLRTKFQCLVLSLALRVKSLVLESALKEQSLPRTTPSRPRPKTTPLKQLLTCYYRLLQMADQLANFQPNRFHSSNTLLVVILTPQTLLLSRFVICSHSILSLWLVHTADANETRQFSLVSTQFRRVLSRLELVSNFQLTVTLLAVNVITVGERSIAISLFVCVSVCLSASISLEPLDRSSRNFCADPMCLWLGSPLVALRYVIHFRFYG